MIFGMIFMLSAAAAGAQTELAVETLDDGSVRVTANGADEGTEVVSEIVIGEEFPAVDVITALEGDSCISVTLVNEETGETPVVLIEAFEYSSHYDLPAGKYTVRFLVKNKAVGGTVTVKACDGADGLSAELAAMLATDDDFPPFASAYGDGGLYEAVSRGAANSVRDWFSEETQLVAAVPLFMRGYGDEEGRTDIFAWTAVYALKSEEDAWTAVGYMLAPVKMKLTPAFALYYKVSDVRWAADGEDMRADLEDMCTGHEGLAEELLNNTPDGAASDKGLISALRDYMNVNKTEFRHKLVVYGDEYDLSADPASETGASAE